MFNELGFGLQQDKFEDYVWHIIDRERNVHATFEDKEEAQEELRIYYS